MSIDQKIYSELVQFIQIEKVELFNLECKQYKRTEPGIAAIDISMVMEEVSRQGEKVIIPSKFAVAAVNDETKEKFFEVNFVFELTYELPVDKLYENEYLQEFAKVNAPINVWPYARELVSNLTARMGFPPLAIPLYK